MKKLTNDEKSIVVGVLMSAGVAGIGILTMNAAATTSTALQAYVGSMITGAMLFNAGVTGVCSLAAIYYNYQATI